MGIPNKYSFTLCGVQKQTYTQIHNHQHYNIKRA